jgi:hypothetical protein
MTSILRRFAENPNTVQTATLSGGNGSNSTTQMAIATINSRYGNVFIIDTTSLVPNALPSKTAFVQLRDATVNAAGALAGKTITILVKLPPVSESASVLGNIDLYFDANFVVGDPLSTSTSFGNRQSFTLVSDGVRFSVAGLSQAWGYAD